MTEEDNLILGMTHEKFKETMLTSAVMSGLSFVMVFVGILVKNYFEERVA